MKRLKARFIDNVAMARLSKETAFNLYNALSFQLVWWTSVLWVNWALWLTIPLLLLHLLLFQRVKPCADNCEGTQQSGLGEAAMHDSSLMTKFLMLKAAILSHVSLNILSLAVLGIVIDGSLTLLGVFQFSHFPWWLALLWLHFCLSLRHSLAFMQRLPVVIQALLGGVFGSLSYLAGAHFGAVYLPFDASVTAGILALVWAILLPFMLRMTLSCAADPQCK